MGRHSFYGNVINPPKFLQHVEGEDNTKFTVDNQGNTLKISGDENYISTSIEKKILTIKHINNNNPESFDHSLNNTPEDNGSYGTILSLPIITSINIDKLGHTNLIKMQDYNFSLIGKRYGESQGEIFNDYSNNIASGQYSHAEGSNTKASGNYSHAEGYGSQAIESRAHAEGEDSLASGYVSHAEGQKTVAEGGQSHAEGRGSKAYANTDHAEGFQTEANGAYNTNDDEGYGAHAEGRETKAWGQGSHAEGIRTTASGHYSHAEGWSTTASGAPSHAEGYNTTASGRYSHAGGCETKAEGIGSFAQGNNTIAKNAYSASFGKFNEDRDDALFQIGYGSKEERQDVFRILNTGMVQIPIHELQAQDVVATKDDNNIKLSEMPINITDTDYYFTITQGNYYEKKIAKTYNAIVKEAKIGYDEEKGKQLILTFYGPDHNDITINVDFSDIYLDAHVDDSDTIDLQVNNNGAIIGEIIGNSIKESHLDNNVISTNKICESAIVTNKIAQNAITTDKIVNEAVTDSKIKNLSFEKITGNVPTARLDGEITTNQIKDGSVTSVKIANEFYTNYIDTKMNITNPVGTGSISINRKTDSIVGQKSSAFGNNNIASGNNSFAEGSGNEARGHQSHTEGAYCSTGANAPNSHAEGLRTQANSSQSHAEGNGTIASKPNQHVQGKWNIEDVSNAGFAHIVGNGTSDINRSNAHTLDWVGNAWYAGQVTAAGMETDAIILRSSTENSNKKFKLTIDDNAVLTIEEV